MRAWTCATGPYPDQARPSSTTGPGRTIRVRDMKSGKPGGTIRARGAILVTGSPGSSGVCRKRLLEAGERGVGQGDVPEPFHVCHSVSTGHDQSQWVTVLRGRGRPFIV
ncbi:hypothetical protein JYK04_01612 [Streptomyces nojiriensis]|nr:hypothetical protein JYK04_01612 [Streptomyces nojiriensis]